MKRLLIPLLLSIGIARAQQQQPVSVPQPDCVIFFSISANGNSGQMNNRTLGCANWAVLYTSTGFSGATITFQDAPDASGSPGTWVTFAGNVITGSNPMTSVIQAKSTFTGYYPWLRVNVSGLTGSGTISGSFYGWRDSADVIGGSGGGGSVPNPIKVVGPDAAGTPSLTDPVQIGANDGTNVQKIKSDTSGNLTTAGVTQAGVPTYACNLQAAITLSASGNTQIIGLSGSTTIRICHVSLSSDTVQDIKFTRGTGSNCGTGTADVTGLYKSVTAMVLDFSPSALLRGAASGAICLNQSASGNAGGVVVYAQY